MSKPVLNEELTAILGSFRAEIATIRTGRAATSLIENIKVEAYPGTPPMAIRELASISVPEPRLIIVDPWDKATLPMIEKALQTTVGLGSSPVVDGGLIRLPTSSLSEEKRRETVKLLNVTLEKFRQQVRDARQEAMRELDRREKDGELSEDEKYTGKKKAEEAVKQVNSDMERLGGEKEAEILRI